MTASIEKLHLRLRYIQFPVSSDLSNRMFYLFHNVWRLIDGSQYRKRPTQWRLVDTYSKRHFYILATRHITCFILSLCVCMPQLRKSFLLCPSLQNDFQNRSKFFCACLLTDSLQLLGTFWCNLIHRRKDKHYKTCFYLSGSLVMLADWCVHITAKKFCVSS